MSNATSTKKLSCDLLVIGSGAGGLSTAITAKKHGLDVIVVEKEEYFGGTTAFSGGVLWIPGNPHAKRDGIQDSRKDMITYMKDQTGNFYDEASVTAFLDQGPEMVEFFERETEVKFLPTLYPDYHPDAPGGAAVGRSIVAEPYDLRGLGPEIARLRPPLTTITFIGMMFNSSNADLKHFFNATKSLISAVYVGKRLSGHLKDLALYKRGVQITSGNALAARLAKSAFNLGIPIHTNAQARELLMADGRVTGQWFAASRRICASPRAVAWCWLAAGIRTTSNASPRLIRTCNAVASICRRRPLATPVTVSAWPRGSAAKSIFATLKRRRGCRSPRFRCPMASSASSRIFSTVISPGSSACYATASGLPTKRIHTTTSARR